MAITYSPSLKDRIVASDVLPLTPPTLDELVDALAKFGRPMLSQFDDGRWYCKVNIHSTVKGVTIEAKHTDASALLAAQGCYMNALALMKARGDAC